VLLWTMASTLALRGLSLRPVINNPAPATRTVPTGCLAPGAGDDARPEEAPPSRGEAGAAQRRAPAGA
ncbi:hypothetical protein PV515_11850, partial [Streptomyces scabiei]|nr:hypothetical protein [Streptomyces scabiei]